VAVNRPDDPWLPPDWGPEPYAGLGPLPPRPALLTRRDLVAGLVTTLALVLLGGPVGLVWEAISPHLHLAAALDGSEEAFHAEIAADGRFLLISIAVGLISAVAALALGRRSGPGVVAGLMTGGLFGAAIAARLGRHIRHDGLISALHSLGASPQAAPIVDFRLRVLGLIVVWPLVAVITYAVLGAVTGWLEPDDRADGG
jgi:hypothetical protein